MSSMRFMKTALFVFAVVLFTGCVCHHVVKEQTARQVRLETLDLSLMYQDWDRPRVNKALNGTTLSINNIEYEHGIGSHAVSVLGVKLNGEADYFDALVGIEDSYKLYSSVVFQVWLDGKKSFETDIMKWKEPAVPVHVDLKGVDTAMFVTFEGPNQHVCDHCNWVEPIIHMKKGSTFNPYSIPVINDPDPKISMEHSELPKINGPRIYGATPGHPFFHMIPASGKRPIFFQAQNLPEGLTLDSETGIISGSLVKEGTTDVSLTVKNSLGEDQRIFRIVAGKECLALTPPMGWNSWNVYGKKITDKKIRKTADYMVKSGLADYGYNYVNIDDGWEGQRNSEGFITSNKDFPDMKNLGVYIHSKGLKYGIYSSPGALTCQGLIGSYEHEEQDAKTFADWGVDYLKYDWCGYGAIYHGTDPVELKKPFQIMRKALNKCDRDIFYSVSQFGHGPFWEWGKDMNVNCWRTTGDIGDCWSSIAGIGFDQNQYADYSEPGHWNDPDMLVVGRVGWGHPLRDSKLNKHEQMTHITMWSMLAAPFILGCELAELDEFTLALLTNPDVLDVDQDPMGKQGTCIWKNEEYEIWARDLYDGTRAIAFFNRAPINKTFNISWKELGYSKKQPVYDLWQRKELGDFRKWKLDVAAHGAQFFKIGMPKKTDF